MAKVTTNEEFQIWVNRTKLANSEPLIWEAMDLHWGGKSGHFFRTSSLDKEITLSGVTNTDMGYIFLYQYIMCL